MEGKLGYQQVALGEGKSHQDCLWKQEVDLVKGILNDPRAPAPLEAGSAAGVGMERAQEIKEFSS